MECCSRTQSMLNVSQNARVSKVLARSAVAVSFWPTPGAGRITANRGRSMKKRCVFAALLVVCSMVPRATRAQIVTFEGVPLGAIGNFYDGGAGPNFGIEFSPNALAVCLRPEANCLTNGSRGGLGDPSSQNTAMFFLGGGSTFLNSTPGFTDGFSFFYSSVFQTGSVNVYSGLGGTGTLLGTLDLGTTTSDCNPAVAQAVFCPFFPVGLSFSGTAHSVVFTGANNGIGFDDVTLGSNTAGVIESPDVTTTPEPSTIALVASGLGVVAIVARRRRARA